MPAMTTKTTSAPKISKISSARRPSQRPTKRIVMFWRPASTAGMLAAMAMATISFDRSSTPVIGWLNSQRMPTSAMVMIARIRSAARPMRAITRVARMVALSSLSISPSMA